MTDSADADVARTAFLACNGGDVQGFLSCLDPQVEWHSAGLFLHPAQAFLGRLAVKEGLNATAEHRGGRPRVTLRELTAAGGLVFVAGTVSIPSGRQPVTLPIAWVMEVRDGLIVHVQTFSAEEHARTELDRLRAAAG